MKKLLIICMLLSTTCRAQFNSGFFGFGTVTATGGGGGAWYPAGADEVWDASLGVTAPSNLVSAWTGQVNGDVLAGTVGNYPLWNGTDAIDFHLFSSESLGITKSYSGEKWVYAVIAFSSGISFTGDVLGCNDAANPNGVGWLADNGPEAIKVYNGSNFRGSQTLPDHNLHLFMLHVHGSTPNIEVSIDGGTIVSDSYIGNVGLGNSFAVGLLSMYGDVATFTIKAVAIYPTDVTSSMHTACQSQFGTP